MANTTANGIAGVPVVSFDVCWHLGSLSTPPKKVESLEGACLSASHCPDAWRRIAKLGGNPLWELRLSGARYLDYHKLSDAQHRDLVAQAVAFGLLARKKLWRVWSYDDEFDHDVFMECDSEEEALDEISAAEEESCRVEPVESVKTVSRLTTLFGHPKHTGTLAEEYGIMALAELAGLDGVWWNDTFDPSGYSAPRIGIFRKALAQYNRREVDTIAGEDDGPVRVRMKRSTIDVEGVVIRRALHERPVMAVRPRLG